MKAAMRTAPMTGAEYTDNPRACPYCRAPYAFDGGHCRCTSCGRRWVRVYRAGTLVGYDPHPPALRPLRAVPAVAEPAPMAGSSNPGPAGLP